MPELLGTELAQAVKKIRPTVKTILVTGFSSQVNLSNADAYGIDCYLEKPLTSDELRRCLAKMLH
jgi:YesN/AraC family two-component response regulator